MAAVPSLIRLAAEALLAALAVDDATSSSEWVTALEDPTSWTDASDWPKPSANLYQLAIVSGSTDADDRVIKRGRGQRFHTALFTLRCWLYSDATIAEDLDDHRRAVFNTIEADRLATPFSTAQRALDWDSWINLIDEHGRAPTPGFDAFLLCKVNE